ncbi:dTDP-glucose 4,6-dehydratase [soil metagenome]
MRILVSGGAGFIGSALIRRIISTTQHSVVNVDKLTYAADLAAVADAARDSRYAFAEVDICDASALRAVFARYQPDGVIHLAAESHVDRSIDAPDAFVQTNVVGTCTLLSEALGYWRRLPEQARRAFRFVHVSTDEVFGSLGETGTFTETSAYDPRSPYAASKASSDHMARAWFHTYGLPVIVTNSSNNYGPFQFPEKLIPLVTQRALLWQSIPVYGTGSNVRDWLFVDDHAVALLAAFLHGVPGRAYNVGAQNEQRNIDVVRRICDLVDAMAPNAAVGARTSLITYVTDRPGHDARYAIDASRITAELGWRPAVKFEDGLRQTVAWYLDHADWLERIRSRAYTGERLGLAVGAHRT